MENYCVIFWFDCGNWDGVYLDGYLLLKLVDEFRF